MSRQNTRGERERESTRSKGRTLISMVALSSLSVVLGGCAIFDGGAKCEETEQYFKESAWPEVIGSNCLSCHSPGGEAGARGAKLEFLPAGYPGFLTTNLERLREFSKIEYEGTPLVLLKPLGKLNHGGAVRFKKGEDDPGYVTLKTMVEKLRAEDTCDASAVEPVYDDVKMLSAARTFRKAALHFAYRLPTSKELSKLKDGGDDALADLVDGLFEEEKFYARLKDLFNDKLLTDRYLNYTGYAVNQLNEEMYPQSGAPWDALTDAELRKKTNRALAREPLELVAYITKNNRPFTDYVAANYTVVNPFSAPYYNANATFQDPTNENEWVEARRQGFIDGKLTELPHAGVLTSPMWLNRYPTTPTNRNRHRARMILAQFLATDILKVGERPLDPKAAMLYANPTRDDPSCSACHKIIDPIAGTFLKFDDYDPEEYVPDREWHNDMEAPGFGAERMTVQDFGAAPEWVARRIIADPRFSQAIVRTVYEGVFGRKPLEYPTDTDAKDHAQSLAAWEGQDATFRAIGQSFVASDYNVKTVFRMLVLSPIYRAESSAEELAKGRLLELGDLGTGRLSTPELLSRKIEVVTGLKWKHGWDDGEFLTRDFNLLYGGIDSEIVNERLTVPNGVMANVQFRMANEVSCQSVAVDFFRSKDARLLFPEVDLTDLPETTGGDAIPAAAERIKKNIVYLFQRVLGESVKVDSADVERVFSLYVETWREGQGLLTADTVHPWLPYQCQARNDPVTGAELADDVRLDDDPDYTIRSWMAVMTFLLADYKFLYE